MGGRQQRTSLCRHYSTQSHNTTVQHYITNTTMQHYIIIVFTSVCFSLSWNKAQIKIFSNVKFRNGWLIFSRDFVPEISLCTSLLSKNDKINFNTKQMNNKNIRDCLKYRMTMSAIRAKINRKFSSFRYFQPRV